MAALQWAAGEGYNVLSVSGGEPLMYRQLDELLEGGRAAGMACGLITNGMLLSRERVERLRGRLDYLAVSLDGTPDSHDRMRGSPRAFAE